MISYLPAPLLVFVPGKVSIPNQFEFGAVFSKNKNKFYYGVFIKDKAETRMMKFEKGSWTLSIPILVHDVSIYSDPFLTPDENRLFFISDQPLSGKGPKKD